jgi:hypothetical protein
MPYSREIPTQFPLADRTVPASVGARVLAARELRAATAGSPRNLAPSFADLSQGAAAPGLLIQEFVRDEVLMCQQGYIAEPNVNDAGLNAVFSQRGAPIAAAIRFDIDVPENLVLPEEDEVR